jgi:phosphomannomutase
MTRRQQDHDEEADDVRETLAEDGRQVIYSTDPDADEPADTKEWLASDTTVSGSDQQ